MRKWCRCSVARAVARQLQIWERMPFLPTLPTDPTLLHGWMLRRLLRCFLLVCMFGVLNVVSGQWSSGLTQSSRTMSVSPRASKPDVSSETSPHRPSTSGKGRAVLPLGWRRTAQGWQHVSTWTKPLEPLPSLHERILAQRAAEPSWVRRLMSVIRSIPPIGIAILQLAAIGLVVRTAALRRNAIMSNIA